MQGSKKLHSRDTAFYLTNTTFEKEKFKDLKFINFDGNFYDKGTASSEIPKTMFVPKRFPKKLVERPNQLNTLSQKVCINIPKVY